MLAGLWYLGFPFFFLWIIGFRRAGWFGLGVAAVLLVLLLGFITGLLFTWFIEPQSYWHAYAMPKLVTNTYTDSLSWDAPMYKMLLIPYLFVFDILRIYVHFSLTHGTLALWIPEFVSFFILRNWYVVYRQLGYFPLFH